MLSHEFGEVTVASDKRLQVKACVYVCQTNIAQHADALKRVVLFKLLEMSLHFGTTGASTCFPATKKLLGLSRALT